MKRLVLLAAMTGIAAPVAARPTLVCRITAWIPYTSAIKPGFDNTRVFTQDAALVEERQSGNAVVRRWTVIADTPAQLVAIDTGAAADPDDRPAWQSFRGIRRDVPAAGLLHGE